MRAFRDPIDALAYLTECTLATVGHMQQLKNAPKHELKRQMSIADKGLEALRAFGDGRKFDGRVGAALEVSK